MERRGSRGWQKSWKSARPTNYSDRDDLPSMATNADDQPGIVPVAPPVALPEPPAVLVVYSYEQLKQYRLQSQPYIVRATYEQVQRMLEDGLLERSAEAYLEWLEWVQANL